MNQKAQPRFKLDDVVIKTSGDYHAWGIIVSVFWNTKGSLRYVVEHQGDAQGMLHIYSEAILEHHSPKK